MPPPIDGPPLGPEYLAVDKGPATIVLLIIFPVLALVAVILRLYTRFCIVRIPSREDYAITLAMVFSIGCMVCQIMQVINGVGKHIQAVPPAQIVESLKALWASIPFYNFGLTLTKISIMFQFLRLATDRPIQILCWISIWFTVAFCFSSLFAGIFQCMPIEKFWNLQVPGTCFNKTAWYYVTAAVSIIQDIQLVVLPFFILRKLLVPRREKIVLMFVLGMGGVAAIASICRLYSLYVISITADITWDSTASTYWAAIELNVGILCASLPTLRPLFARIWPNAFSSSVGSRDTGANGGNRSAGQYINMESNIMVRKTIALQSSRDVSDIDTVIPHSQGSSKRVREAWDERALTAKV